MATWREQVVALMRSFRGNTIDVDGFVREYERLWNFEREQGDILPLEVELFEHLFDVAAAYSPFSEDRAHNTRFKSEEDVRTLVLNLLARLD